MDMIQSRNSTSHTYNEEIAADIVNAILTEYFERFVKFQQQFLKLEKSS